MSPDVRSERALSRFAEKARVEGRNASYSDKIPVRNVVVMGALRLHACGVRSGPLRLLEPQERGQAFTRRAAVEVVCEIVALVRIIVAPLEDDYAAPRFCSEVLVNVLLCCRAVLIDTSVGCNGQPCWLP